MQDRVVWWPVGKSRAVGLHMSQAKFQLKFRPCPVKTDSPGLSYWTPHHTILHLFVIPAAYYAAKLLLRMGKERPKHVELLSF
jgi:hypothetical protein